MIHCTPGLAKEGHWRNKRRGSGYWNAETETTVWRQSLKGSLIFNIAIEPAWNDLARRENKYSFFTVLPPSDLLLGHPLAKPNQMAESKRVLAIRVDQGREQGEGHRVGLEGRWRTCSLPIDSGKMKPSLKVGKLINLMVLYRKNCIWLTL